MERDIPLNIKLHFKSISTHTLTWSVTDKTTLKGVAGKDFNSHAHVERDVQNCNYLPWHCHFNSHAHVERDFEFFDNEMYIPNFNSHAHVERDFAVCKLCAERIISTHTLTWSVTALNISHKNSPDISTHTLTWSVTADVQEARHGKWDFNSHAHVERDT